MATDVIPHAAIAPAYFADRNGAAGVVATESTFVVELTAFSGPLDLLLVEGPVDFFFRGGGDGAHIFRGDGASGTIVLGDFAGRGIVYVDDE